MLRPFSHLLNKNSHHFLSPPTPVVVVAGGVAMTVGARLDTSTDPRSYKGDIEALLGGSAIWTALET
jgi:hypothetical protein